MDEYVCNLQPTSIGKKDDPDRSLGTEELAMYTSTLVTGEVACEQACARVGLRCERTFPKNTNKVGEIKVHHATELDKLVRIVKVCDDFFSQT